MNEKRLRIVIIAGFVVLSLAIAGIIAAIMNSQGSSVNEPKQTSYVDPASGETVLDTEGKTPEYYGVNPNRPNFLGFYNLFDAGMLDADIEEVKGFLNDYADKQLEEGKPKLTEISLYVDTIGHAINQETHEETFDLNLLVNREQQFQLKIVTNAETAKRTYSLIQDEKAIYSQVKDIE